MVNSNALNFISRGSGETVKVLDQVGKSNKKIDASRTAKLPGKRISKNGKVYWETRKNRSDAPLKNT